MTEKTKRNIKLLIEFYEINGRWPYARESYKGVKIGNFARNVSYNKIKLDNYHYDLLSKMEFFTSVVHKRVLILLKFLNTNKRYPYTNEFFCNLNIYRFANLIKKGKLDGKISEEDKKTLNQNIYFNSKYKQYIYHKKTLLLIKFYDTYKRWPIVRENFENVKIGEFSSSVRRHRIDLSDSDKKILKDKNFPFK